MNLLLDTHIWIYALEDRARLSRDVVRELERRSNSIYLSPVSVWEAHLLNQRKKLKTARGFDLWLESALSAGPLRQAPFTFEVAAEAAHTVLPQPDLGDLLIAATAVVHDLTLVTADQQLIDCTWLKTLAND